ncbi:MAG: hypothetical protein IJ525_00720 [Alphaproteobacteria bacterium]|nr:hypothetical protein [Alphaproteobacteria bacterium]
MRNLKVKNIKSHPSQSLAKANASRDLQINFNQAEDALTIPAESRHDYKCGSTTQSGRSMIEMLGVLAIIGVLSVGGIAGYSKAMMKYRINKSIEQISLISQNVRSFFASQRNYAGLNSPNYNNTNGLSLIKKAKLVPDEMIDENNSIEDGFIGEEHHIFNTFGGGVVIWNNLYGIDSDECDDSDCLNTLRYFQIIYFGLPQEACIELATQDWSSSAMGLTAMKVINHEDIDLPVEAKICLTYPNGLKENNSIFACPNGTTVPVPVPLDIAVDACDCPNNDCTIMWGFK